MIKLSDINLLAFGNTIHMVGAVYQGDGVMYLTLFPEDRGTLDVIGKDYRILHIDGDGEESEVKVLDMDADDWKKFMFQSDVMETEVLTQASDGSLAKAIIRKSQRNIEQAVSWKTYKRDGYRCRYCANDDVPLTVDHLVLWEDGGPSIVDNLVSACKKCNKTRGNLQYSQWLAHPYYLKVSKNLSEQDRLANHHLINTLDRIPRLIHKRSR